MPRARDRRNAWLPVGVYRLRGRYVLRRDGTQVTLAPGDADQATVLRAWNEATKAAPHTLTLRELTRRWQASREFLKLARRTQTDATAAINIVCNTATRTRTLFGDAPVASISIVVMRRYMDKRGETSETRADRELAYLSMAFTWARERGLVDGNPCIGIRRFNPAARTRYVTDDELRQRVEIAIAKGRTDLAAAMQLAWLCRLRISEVCALREADITAAGVLARRSKGSKTQVIEWSPDLEAAIAQARSVRRRVATQQLIVSSASGLPLTVRALQEAWRLAQVEAARQGHATDWHFHDLKAKGVSDAPGDKHLASGHRTQRMTAVYDRLPGKAPPTR